MSHARTSIRDAFVSALTGLTTTKSRVYKSRVYPLDNDNLPGLTVFVSTEEIDEEEGKIARIQHRYCEIVVKGYDKLTAGLDDQLDTIAEEVETAIFNTTIPGSYGLDLINSESDIKTGAEKPVGEITLTFRVQYLTEEGAPNTAL